MKKARAEMKITVAGAGNVEGCGGQCQCHEDFASEVVLSARTGRFSLRKREEQPDFFM